GHGTGSVRGTEPSATMSWSYGTSRRWPSALVTNTCRASGSAPVTWPRSRSVWLRCSRSGTTTWRGSSVPAAAPGSSGVYSMKLTSVTIVTFAACGGSLRSSFRAAYRPPNPPPRMTMFQAMRRDYSWLRWGATSSANRAAVTLPPLIVTPTRLPRHHPLVVVGMDRHEPALGHQRRQQLLAVLRVAVEADHLGAVALRGGDLAGRRVVGHEDHGPRPGQPRSEGDRLGVVAGRHG